MSVRKNTNLGKSILMFLFSVALMVYVLIRAYSLSFVHDECLSFTIVEGIIGFENTPNHHILNTLLMSLSNSLLGNSEFALRLPNVLAFLFYLLGGYLIFRPTKNNWLFLLGISLTLLNPFLIEFFSLARGYGLSLGFMLMGIYYLTKESFNYPSYPALIKDFVGAVIFASLAVYANLIMINFLIAVIILFILKCWVVKRKELKNIKHDFAFLLILCSSFIPLLLGTQRLLFLKKLNQLYFGGITFTETIDSLITASIPFGANIPWLYLVLKILLAVLFLIALLSIFLKKAYNSQLFIATGLIFLLTIGLLLEHFFFDAKYPLGRTALFYLPVFAIFIYHLSAYLIEHHKVKKNIYIPIFAGLLSPIYFNFFIQINTTYTTTWRYDAHTKETMQIIAEKLQKTPKKAYITNNWLFEPSINYYRKRWKLNLNPANRYGTNLNCDFIYRLEDTTRLENFELLQTHTDIQSDLLMQQKKG